MEEEKGNTYKDKKIGHQRGFFDYLKFKAFLLGKLNNNSYDKIIVFGIQLIYILKEFLEKKYKGEYVLDIRDYHKIIHFSNIKSIIGNSTFVVLSSPGFKQWLPPSNKYVINHNTHLNNIYDIKSVTNFNEDKLTISNIGATRDFSVNRDLIQSLKNSNRINLNYHGEGDINQDILAYVQRTKISNVLFTGRYYPEEENKFYSKSDIINVLRYNDGINNRTALPNRLYNALINGKPLLAYNGTYLAEIITANNIGIVLHSFNTIENDILKFIKNYNTQKYDEDRRSFLERIIQENKKFEEELIKFIK